MDELTRLALAARDGDPAAFGAFVRRGQGEGWRFVAGLVGRTEADDVTQDTSARAWRALHVRSRVARARGDLVAAVRAAEAAG